MLWAGLASHSEPCDRCKPIPQPATSRASDSLLGLSSPSLPVISSSTKLANESSKTERLTQEDPPLQTQKPRVGRIHIQRIRPWGFTSLWTQLPNNSPQGERLGRGQAPWRLNYSKNMHQPSLLGDRILQYNLLPQSHQDRTPNLCPNLQKLSIGTPIDQSLHWAELHKGARASDTPPGGLHL